MSTIWDRPFGKIPPTPLCLIDLRYHSNPQWTDYPRIGNVGRRSFPGRRPRFQLFPQALKNSTREVCFQSWPETTPQEELFWSQQQVSQPKSTLAEGGSVFRSECHRTAVESGIIVCSLSPKRARYQAVCEYQRLAWVVMNTRLFWFSFFENSTVQLAASVTARIRMG